MLVEAEKMCGVFFFLVGGLEHFFHILGIVTPTDELIFFKGVGIPPTSVFFPEVKDLRNNGIRCCSFTNFQNTTLTIKDSKHG